MSLFSMQGQVAVITGSSLGIGLAIDEIAGAAIFLSTQAGSFMTGQALVIDGGVTI